MEYSKVRGKPPIDPKIPRKLEYSYAYVEGATSGRNAEAFGKRVYNTMFEQGRTRAKGNVGGPAEP
jgi:hypothetical protein